MSHTGKTIALNHRKGKKHVRNEEDRRVLMTSVNKELQSPSILHLLGGTFYLSTSCLCFTRSSNSEAKQPPPLK